MTGMTMNTIRTVGVVGAGQMGNGIAHVCALAGYDVLLNDNEPARLDAAMETIRVNLSRQVHRESIRQSDMDAALGRIRKSPKLGDFSACDFLIESVAEKEEAKREVFANLRDILKTDAILASNT